MEDQPSSPPRLIRVPDAARQLTISERHLRGLIIRHQVPVVRIGRSVRIAATVLDKIAREGV